MSLLLCVAHQVWCIAHNFICYSFTQLTVQLPSSPHTANVLCYQSMVLLGDKCFQLFYNFTWLLPFTQFSIDQSIIKKWMTARGKSGGTTEGWLRVWSPKGKQCTSGDLNNNTVSIWGLSVSQGGNVSPVILKAERRSSWLEGWKEE